MIRVEKFPRLPVLVVLLALAVNASSRAAPAKPDAAVAVRPRPSWAGDYAPASDPNGRVILEPTAPTGGVVVRTSEGWGAIGFLEAGHFEGVVRSADLEGEPLPGPPGTIAFDVLDDGRIAAVLRRGGSEWTETWVRRRVAWNEAPNRDDFHYIEELPEPIEKPAPNYPPEARKAGIEGTVLLQVLVGKDGRVHDTKLVKSIPALDAAAVAAVKRWRFKPALSNGEPLSVWVAVPVRFALKR